MFSWVTRLLSGLAGSRDATSDDEPETDTIEAGGGEDEFAAGSESDDDRVEGTGEAILDEVYGNPAASRAVDRIERRARELEDERR